MIFSRDLLEKIRDDFPRAVSDLNGRKRAFFVNGTGTLVVGRAAKSEAEARIDCSANVDGIFGESKKAEDTILEGRKAVADLLNAPSPECARALRKKWVHISLVIELWKFCC